VYLASTMKSIKAYVYKLSFVLNTVLNSYIKKMLESRSLLLKQITVLNSGHLTFKLFFFTCI